MWCGDWGINAYVMHVSCMQHAFVLNVPSDVDSAPRCCTTFAGDATETRWRVRSEVSEGRSSAVRRRRVGRVRLFWVCLSFMRQQATLLRAAATGEGRLLFRDTVSHVKIHIRHVDEVQHPGWGGR